MVGAAIPFYYKCFLWRLRAVRYTPPPTFLALLVSRGPGCRFHPWRFLHEKLFRYNEETSRGTSGHSFFEATVKTCNGTSQHTFEIWSCLSLDYQRACFGVPGETFESWCLCGCLLKNATKTPRPKVAQSQTETLPAIEHLLAW